MLIADLTQLWQVEWNSTFILKVWCSCLFAAWEGIHVPLTLLNSDKLNAAQLRKWLEPSAATIYLCAAWEGISLTHTSLYVHSVAMKILWVDENGVTLLRLYVKLPHIAAFDIIGVSSGGLNIWLVHKTESHKNKTLECINDLNHVIQHPVRPWSSASTWKQNIFAWVASDCMIYSLWCWKHVTVWYIPISGGEGMTQPCSCSFDSALPLADTRLTWRQMQGMCSTADE